MLATIRASMKSNPNIRRAYYILRFWVYQSRYRMIGILKFGILARARPNILFYPLPPRDHKAIVRICLVSKYKMQLTPSAETDLVIAWDDETFRDPVKTVPGVAPTVPILNGECVDISKDTLDRHHRDVFGYGLEVDPLTFSGEAVVKSDLNAAHDGRVIKLPVESLEAGVVYQRVIDNTADDGLVVDIRVPVFRDRIPFAYLKYRPISTRFSNTNAHVKIVTDVASVLSEEEQANIIELSRRIGVDFTELDTLRDNGTGKLYVVDVNHTPAGPPNGLSRRDHWRALEMLSECFYRSFIADLPINTR